MSAAARLVMRRGSDGGGNTNGSSAISVATDSVGDDGAIRVSAMVAADRRVMRRGGEGGTIATDSSVTAVSRDAGEDGGTSGTICDAGEDGGAICDSAMAAAARRVMRLGGSGGFFATSSVPVRVDDSAGDGGTSDASAMVAIACRAVRGGGRGGWTATGSSAVVASTEAAGDGGTIGDGGGVSASGVGEDMAAWAAMRRLLRVTRSKV